MHPPKRNDASFDQALDAAKARDGGVESSRSDRGPARERGTEPEGHDAASSAEDRGVERPRERREQDPTQGAEERRHGDGATSAEAEARVDDREGADRGSTVTEPSPKDPGTDRPSAVDEAGSASESKPTAPASHPTTPGTSTSGGPLDVGPTPAGATGSATLSIPGGSESPGTLSPDPESPTPMAPVTEAHGGMTGAPTTFVDGSPGGSGEPFSGQPTPGSFGGTTPQAPTEGSTSSPTEGRLPAAPAQDSVASAPIDAPVASDSAPSSDADPWTQGQLPDNGQDLDAPPSQSIGSKAEPMEAPSSRGQRSESQGVSTNNPWASSPAPTSPAEALPNPAVLDAAPTAIEGGGLSVESPTQASPNAATDAVAQERAGTPVPEVESTDTKSRTSPAVDTKRAADVLRQVQLKLTPETRQATLRLRPESLGEVVIRLETDDGQVKAHMRVERPEAYAALERHAPELRAALESRGFENPTLELSLAPEGEAWQQPDSSPSDQAADPGSSQGAGRAGGDKNPASTSSTDAEAPAGLVDQLASDLSVDFYA